MSEQFQNRIEKSLKSHANSIPLIHFINLKNEKQQTKKYTTLSEQF